MQLAEKTIAEKIVKIVRTSAEREDYPLRRKKTGTNRAAGAKPFRHPYG
ncbi:hypothetical protein [Methanosarcina barkeri]|nr:hypothetical protein [Methanosarcina barkeri]